MVILYKTSHEVKCEIFFTDGIMSVLRKFEMLKYFRIQIFGLGKVNLYLIPLFSSVPCSLGTTALIYVMHRYFKD